MKIVLFLLGALAIISFVLYKMDVLFDFDDNINSGEDQIDANTYSNFVDVETKSFKLKWDVDFNK